MATFGTNSNIGVPTAFQFSYDGEVVDWGTTRLLRVNDVSNKADPVDNKLRISDMTVSFVDTSGEIWGSMGNGTSVFNKEITGTVFVGGSMGYVSSDIGVDFKKVSEVGAWVKPFFSGKITNASKRDRVVTLRAQNNMNLLPLVKWQLPTARTVFFTMGSYYNKYSFSADDAGANATWGSLLNTSCFNKDDGNSKADFWAYPTDNNGISEDYESGVLGIFDTSEGTGIENTLIAPNVFLNDQFYRDFPNKFQGSFLGTYRGTISSGTVANSLGWADLAESEAHVNIDDDGTFYVINKSRFTWPSGTADPTLVQLHGRQLFRMVGDPTGILRHLLFGKMVTSYYNEDTHMGTDTFYEAARVTAYKNYDQIINPDDETVLPYIQDLLTTESSLFYTSLNNQFNFEPYGPQDLVAALEEIGTVDIHKSSYTNDIKDTYNRVILNYDWSFDSGEYTKKQEGSSIDWDVTDDRPLDLSSKWVKNNNQALTTVKRQLKRYERTSPKLSFTTSLKYADMNIGSLVKVTDQDSGVTDKIIQILDYTKGFGNANNITFSGYDGESLFLQRGYAMWEGSNVLDVPVDVDSVSGWGTTLSGIGTTLGIDEDTYGTQFVWW